MKKIGITILSTNRSRCLERLVYSMEKCGINDNIDVFVLDDSPEGKIKRCIRRFCTKRSWIRYKNTGNMIGIVNNSNNALEILKPYEYKMMLNNDVEILHKDWWNVYFDAMEDTGIHHFCFQQQGMWGHGKKQRPHIIQEINGIKVRTIKEKPMGAILTFDKLAQDTVGFYDTIFPRYGMSHHDWTNRVSLSGIQINGIHDLAESNKFFKIHNEQSCTERSVRLNMYEDAIKIYNHVKGNMKRINIENKSPILDK